MKKWMRGSILIFVVLLVPAVVNATLVKQVQLTQATGGYANYDSGTGTITWSGGGGGWLLTDDYGYVSFTDSDITGTFSGVTDTSSGNLASALFASGSWSLQFEFGGWLNPVFTISGHTAGNYAETETGVDTNKLDGRSIVIVDDAQFTLGFFEDYFNTSGVSMEWEGGIGTYAGLIADVTLPITPDFTNYTTQDYASTNLIVTLWADESQVPEPATITLFGAAGLFLLRRKKKM